MDPVTRAALESFRFDPWVVVPLAVLAAVYVRGWLAVHRQMPARFGAARLAAFLCGIAVLLVAVASPLDAFAGLLLTAHMVQHVLLTMVAAPLLLLGAPQVPLLRGLPARLVREALGPFLAAPELRSFGRELAHPVVALLVFVTTMWGWHLPALYELALRAPAWHALEHVSFLAAALLFWWPVVEPWPSVARWPRWTVIPYLMLADLSNTVLSSLFAFSERVLYPAYAAAPRLGGIDAAEDQAIAGAIMWVTGSLGYLVPAGVIAARLLSPRLVPPGDGRPPADALPLALALARSTPGAGSGRSPARGERRTFDLLEVPLLGGWLRRRHSRRALQIVFFVLAALVVADGFLGPAMAPMNLAGVLPWTYWRGLVVVALLAAGNFFCFACPFVLPREAARRLLPARLAWPRRLRSKWLAAALLVAWFCVYEAAAPWDVPAFTAWIVVGYMAAALLVDGLFRGASFCKYVCPIGQFNFVHATLSPLEVRAKDAATCGSCATHDCLRGTAVQRGCELELFLPRKVGNLDCTFCLDCVKACPHDNVGVLAVAPAAELIRDERRSSLRRLSRRPDVAALALVLVFAAFASAAAMVAPVASWEETLIAQLAARGASPLVTGGEAWPITAALLAATLLPLPLLLAGACALAGRAFSGGVASGRELFCRFSLALVPLGASMWLAHLLFHLVTGAATIVPVAQRAAEDVGLPSLGTPDWSLPAMSGEPAWLLPLLILILDAGLLVTLWVGHRISASVAGDAHPGRGLGLLAPWGGLACALWVLAVWILLQPMEMRGMMVH